MTLELMWLTLFSFSLAIYPCIIIVFLLYLRHERIILEQCRRATTEESKKMLSYLHDTVAHTEDTHSKHA